MGQESCRPRILFGMSFALHYSFCDLSTLPCQPKHISKYVCVCFDMWVAGNVAGFAQKNMVAHVSADLLLDWFVDLFVELFVHLCVNRFVDLFVYTFVDQTL